MFAAPEQYSLTLSCACRFKGASHWYGKNCILIHPYRLNVRQVHQGQGVNGDISSRKTDTTSSSSIPEPHPINSNIRFAAAESKPGIDIRTNSDANDTTNNNKLILD